MIKQALRVLWWLAFAASVALLIGSLPGYAASLPATQPAGEFASIQLIGLWLGTILSIACVLLCLGLAVLLYFRRRDDSMALFLSFYLLMYATIMSGPIEMFLPFWIPGSVNLALGIQGIVFLVPSLALILVFPTGRFQPRWTRWLVVIAVLLTLIILFFIRDLDEIVRINTSRAQLYTLLLGFLLLVALGTQVYRYRRLYSREKQQTKWVVFGLLLSFLVQAILAIPYYIFLNSPAGTLPGWWVPLMSPLWWLGISILPVALTVAILRARLWDIDVIVRRTVSYGLVTLSLALIYFASVVVLQQIFAELTGSEHSEIVTVLSTLGIAALFVPVRNRIQAAIDRRFNRAKYDTQRVLNDFSTTVRDETDLERLAGRLMQVVDETMQPKDMEILLSTRMEPRSAVRGRPSSVGGRPSSVSRRPSP